MKIKLSKPAPVTIDKPHSIQVEFTEGCTRLCSFCGLNGIRSKPGGFLYMTLETGRLLAQQIKDFAAHSRIEFAMHGEPTMNPNYLELIKLFREALPQTQMQITTNGVRFRNGKLLEQAELLFGAGIDFILLNTYHPERVELREQIKKAENNKLGIVFHDFYRLKDVGLSAYYNYHRKKLTRTIVHCDDIGLVEDKPYAKKIVNHAGSNPQIGELKEPLKKTCTLPFREVSITYAGDVRICCQDWKGKMMVNNIHKASLQKIWESEKFQTLRALLQNKNRNFSPCNVCDKDSGPRSGLLPKMKLPNQEALSRNGIKLC